LIVTVFEGDDNDRGMGGGWGCNSEMMIVKILNLRLINMGEDPLYFLNKWRLSITIVLK